MPNARTRRKRSVKPQEGGPLVINIVDPTPNLLVTDFTMNIEPDSGVVAVILTRDMVVKVTGQNTGRLYVFNGAGSVIEDVDGLDAEAMLQKGLNKSCCGTQSTPYFQILGR